MGKGIGKNEDIIKWCNWRNQFWRFSFAEAFQQKVGNLVGEDNVYWYESRYALSDFLKSIYIMIKSIILVK